MAFKFGGVNIDPIAYGSQGSAVLGIRDSGKSYTATELAERVFEAGIPFVAFDPVGVWRFLRVPGHGRGYPVVVAGGKAGDLPLTVAAAPEYVRAAMRDGVSLVIDLFDINLSKADWKRIVMQCVRVLLHENSAHGLRHIFLEEAAEFAPQRVGPDQGQVYAEIEKLARMGGNARLGYTLINQRAEEVNKAVLELCDNLFLHRQKGRNSLTALSKWLDIGAVKDHKAIIESLSTLPTGECWAWMAGTETPIRVKVPAKNSLHPDRRVMRSDSDIKIKAAVDVGTFVASMRASLGKIEQEAKANDPAVLRKQIGELERQLRGVVPSAMTKEDLAAEYQRGYGDGQMNGYQQAISQFESYTQKIEDWIGGRPSAPAFSLPPSWLEPRKPPKRAPSILERIQSAPPASIQAHARRRGQTNGSESPAGDLSPSARKIIDVINRAYPVSLSFDAAARRAGISKKSSAYRGYRKEVEQWPDFERIGTQFRGKHSVSSGDVPGPMGLDSWVPSLPPTYGRMLLALKDGRHLFKENIADIADISPSSSGLGAGLRELLSLELITRNSDGSYSLAEGL